MNLLKNSFLIVVSLTLFLTQFALANDPIPNDLPELALDQEKIFIGNLEQQPNTPANHQILLKRSTKTPEKVELSFNFQFLNNVCVRYETRYEYRPGYCYPQPQPYCPGEWVAVQYCVQYQDVLTNYNKEIVLDFDKAYGLDGEEFETFALTIAQKDFRSADVHLSAQAVTVKGPYKIKKRGVFHREGLEFKIDD